ncbi:hypothetical protein Ais01nite_21270 [Asanoa ishikariensis]|nr:hypothetical protein Ais01nite_21270 [Asanoa ishikariensis]
MQVEHRGHRGQGVRAALALLDVRAGPGDHVPHTVHIGAIDVDGPHRGKNAGRRAGDRFSSNTRNASDRESAVSAWSAGEGPVTTGSGNHSPTYRCRRTRQAEPTPGDPTATDHRLTAPVSLRVAFVCSDAT